jgi:hypothetical protein
VPELFTDWSLDLKSHWCGALQDIGIEITVENYSCVDKVSGCVGERVGQVAADLLCRWVVDQTSTER